MNRKVLGETTVVDLHCWVFRSFMAALQETEESVFGTEDGEWLPEFFEEPLDGEDMIPIHLTVRKFEYQG